MHHPTLKVVAVALLSAGFTLGAIAQTPTPSTGAPRAATADKSLPRADRKFIENAAQDGMAEVELGKLAAQKARSPEVKQFAERMVQDHTKANQQLLQIAQAKGVNVPTALDSKHQRTLEKLSKLSADKFDHQYMDEMTDDHKKDVKAFREAAKDAKDPDVKSFAANTLPVLEEHQKMADLLYAKVKDMDKAARSSGAGGMGSGTATGRAPSGAGGTPQ